MGEIIFVIALVGGMLGSGVLLGLKTKRWQFFWTIFCFFMCFGFWEWRATATGSGNTMSQDIGQFGISHPTLFWIMIGMLVVSWGALMVHFIAMRKK